MLQFVKILMISVEAIVAVLLIGIILIQKSKGGGGLGTAFGGGGGDSLFGSRAGNVLTRGTIVLAVVFMLNTIGLAILYARSHDRALMDDHLTPTPATQQQQPRGDVQRPVTTGTEPMPAQEVEPFQQGIPDVDMTLEDVPPVDTDDQP